MKVVDASALVNVLLATPAADAVRPLLDDDLFAPELLVPETLRAVHRATLAGRVARREADRIADLLLRAPIEYLSVWPRQERLWGLRHDLSLYDACYVILAEELKAPLVTSDRRLAAAAGEIVPILLAP